MINDTILSDNIAQRRYTSSIMAIRHVFVYGSLRPEDDSDQAWTKEAVRGLRSQKATLSKARLFHDQYACAVLDSSYDKNHSILGYVLSTNDEQLFKEKLALFDDRRVQKVLTIQTCTTGQLWV
mmetsp:Transcript_11919/g.21219  ORF Transcript_11919/g.21219 Transcript_11919/m.21219 type:complete len:124 (-) Transcript_11919:85-456(-)